MIALLLLPLDSAIGLYAVLFSVLILSGVGLPVPEEATLLLGGYLAYLEFVRFWPTVVVLILGIVTADSAGYWLGRLAGNWIFRTLSRFPTCASLLRRAQWYFEQHGEKVTFFSRPLLGVRVIVPILAGHFRMRFFTFLAFDAIAAVLWTLFLVSLSYFLGAGLDLITEVREIKHAAFALVGLAILGYAALKFVKNKSAST